MPELGSVGGSSDPWIYLPGGIHHHFVPAPPAPPPVLGGFLQGHGVIRFGSGDGKIEALEKRIAFLEKALVRMGGFPSEIDGSPRGDSPNV